MVEEITTAIARLPWLFVIARNSSFVYKGRSVDVKQVGRELGVRYVLEGSVRKAGNRVRITGQLIDATTGAHLWSERFDGTLDDIFALQDKVASSVAGAIEPKLRRAEIERASRKPIGSLDAYDLYLRALAQYYKLAADGTNAAVALAERALAIDPAYAPAAALIAVAAGRNQGWGSGSPAEIAEAVRLARQAIEAGRDDPDTLWMGASTLSNSRRRSRGRLDRHRSRAGAQPQFSSGLDVARPRSRLVRAVRPRDRGIRKFAAAEPARSARPVSHGRHRLCPCRGRTVRGGSGIGGPVVARAAAVCLCDSSQGGGLHPTRSDRKSARLCTACARDRAQAHDRPVQALRGGFRAPGILRFPRRGFAPGRPPGGMNAATMASGGRRGQGRSDPPKNALDQSGKAQGQAEHDQSTEGGVGERLLAASRFA